MTPDATADATSGHHPDATLHEDAGKHDAARTEAGKTDATHKHDALARDGHAPDAVTPDGGADAAKHDAPGTDARSDGPKSDVVTKSDAAKKDGGKKDAAGRDAGADAAEGDSGGGDGGEDAAEDAGHDAGHDAGVDAPPGDAGIPLSCRTPGAGTTVCGTSGDSCCRSFVVDGGTYNRTYLYTDGGAGPVEAGNPATVATFVLDEYPVTVGRFRAFQQVWSTTYNDAGVDAGATCDAGHEYHPAEYAGKHRYLNDNDGLVDVSFPTAYEYGWDNNLYDCSMQPTMTNLMSCGPLSTWTPSPGPGPHEAEPINCVTWYEAYAFCIWDGGFLPSEAEWEYAAAGGAAQLDYPWGGTSFPAPQSSYAIADCDYGPACGPAPMPGPGNIADVGMAASGVGPYGQRDLVGEVREWVLDFYDPYLPSVNGANVTGVDYAGNVARGASFGDGERYLHPWYRDDATNASFGRNANIGVRCARPPSP